METDHRDEQGRTGRAEWRSGWPLVAAAMIGIGFGPSLFQNLSSLFTPGMVAEFGWSRGQIATATGVGLLGGLAVPFLGRVADRVGVKPVIMGAMLLIGLAYLGLAAIDGRMWHYQLLILCLTLTVAGASPLVYGKLIGAAFERHRGLALGIATSGISISTLALPPLVGWVIAAYGWRGGFAALAILTTGIALPLVLFALRGRAAAPTRPDPGDPATALPVEGMTGAEVRRDSRFWRLTAAALLINLATIGLVTQLVPFGFDRGLPPGQAALLLTSYGASQVVGRLVIGWLVDRYRPQLMAAIFAVISSIAFVALQADEPGFAFAMTAVFAAGLMNGADHDLMPYFGVRLFGLRAFGEMYGTLLVGGVAGVALGIVGFGVLHDMIGGYGIALAIAAAALALAAALFLSLQDRALPHVQAAARG